MKRKKDAVHKAAHIKANTLGTSNELSFDVLEAAKNQLDGKDGRSNEIVIKKPGKSVGVISLLFSKIAFPSRKTGDDATEQVADLSTAALGDQGKSTETLSSLAQLSEGRPAATTIDTVDLSPLSVQGTQKKARSWGKKDKKKADASLASAGIATTSEDLRRPLLTQEDTQVEIDRRKKIRRKHRFRVRLAVIVVLLAGLAASGYFLAQQIQLRSNQSATFDSAVNSISSVDADLVLLDELLANPLTNVRSGEWQEERKKLTAMRDNLAAAQEKASFLAEEASVNEMRVAARQVVAACEARSTMIDAGERIFSEADRANQVRDSLDTVWASVLAADSTARAAAELLGSATLDGTMQEAIAKFNDAAYMLDEALRELESIEEGYPHLDLSVYKTYLERRLEAVYYGANTAQALLDRDKNAAYAQVELYNASDAAAASAAASLPATMATPVEQAFNANIEADQRQYSEARMTASAADDVIRDYLGVHDK